MNINTVTVALLRLTSLVLLYFIVIHISHLIYMIAYSDWSGLLMSVLALLMLSTATTVFWFYPAQFSNLLFKDTETSLGSTINATHILHIGIILFGFAIFTLAFIELAKWLIYLSIMNTPPEVIQNDLLKVGLLNILARLLVGVLILTKSYWFTQLLLKANQPEPTNNEIK